MTTPGVSLRMRIVRPVTHSHYPYYLIVILSVDDFIDDTLSNPNPQLFPTAPTHLRSWRDFSNQDQPDNDDLPGLTDLLARITERYVSLQDPPQSLQTPPTPPTPLAGPSTQNTLHNTLPNAINHPIAQLLGPSIDVIQRYPPEHAYPLWRVACRVQYNSNSFSTPTLTVSFK